MIRDYQIVSPSLEGVLSHDSITYEGLKRPIEIFRVLDGPAAKPKGTDLAESEQKVLAQYFQDLYGIFMKKLSYFVVESDPAAEEGVKLQAMLQEMIKVKKLTSRLS